MAAPINPRDIALAASLSRVSAANLPSNVTVPVAQVDGMPQYFTSAPLLELAATQQVFQMPDTGAPVVPSITLKAVPKNLAGNVTWTVVEGSATLGVNANQAVLNVDAMTSDFVTIRAAIGDVGSGGGGGGGGGSAIKPLGHASAALTLTFSDDFTSASLDRTKWNDKLWSDDEAIQVNYSVADGFLNIWPDTGFVRRTIDTDGKFAQRFGYWEVKARLPRGKGLVPAFWLYTHASDTVRPGIDIMKTWCGATSGGAVGGLATINVHYYGDGAIWGADGATGATESQVATPMPVTFDANINAGYVTSNKGLKGGTMQRIWAGSTAYGIDTFANRLAGESANAHVIIINCCIQDTYEALGTANYKERVRDLVTAVRSANKYIILQTPNETDDAQVDVYRTALLEVASELNVSMIDVYGYTRDYRVQNAVSIYSLCDNGYNPNQAHHTRIGQFCASTFEVILAQDPSAPKLQTTAGTQYANTSFQAINYRAAVHTANGGTAATRNLAAASDLSGAAHTYGMKWDHATGDISFYFDGVQVGATVTGASPAVPLYFLASLWYGELSGEPNTTDTLTGAAYGMQIDHVRVWQWSALDSGGGNTTPTPAINGSVDWYGNSTVAGWNPSYNGTAQEGQPVATPMPAAFHAKAPTTTGVNRGVNGVTAADAINGTDGIPWSSWPTHLASTSAAYVILQYRETDTVANLTANLTTLVNQAKAAGKTVFIQTDIPSLNAGSLTHQTIAQTQRQVGIDTNVYVLDLHRYLTDYMVANNLTIANICPDTQHPSQAIYTLLGEWAKDEVLRLLAGTSAYTPGGSGGTTNPPPSTPSGYVAPVGQSQTDYPTMTFRDEFNGTSINATKWPLRRLSYEGDGWNGRATYDRGNIDVNNGRLRLWATPWNSATDGATRYPSEASNQYVNHNATICTDGAFWQRYGYFECRAKLPHGSGTFPAFWLYCHQDTQGNEIGTRPEIDVMEAYSSGPYNWQDGNNHPTNHVCTVWVGDGNRAGYVKANDVGMDGADLSAAFHTYACRWDSEKIVFFFDGQQFGAPIYHHYPYPMFFMFDFWMGGESGPPAYGQLIEGPSNSLEIDYIRAWALADGSTFTRGLSVAQATAD